MFNPQGQVLLVRHSYGSGSWMLPGGGLGRNEDAVAGAVRELAEEVGGQLDQARLVMRLEEPLSGATNHVHIVTGVSAAAVVGDCREVISARFFAPGSWPEELSLSHSRGLDDWVRAAEAALRA